MQPDAFDGGQHIKGEVVVIKVPYFLGYRSFVVNYCFLGHWMVSGNVRLHEKKGEQGERSRDDVAPEPGWMGCGKAGARAKKE